MLPDTNVLVAAYRADHPHHRVAANWLKSSLKEAKDGQRLMLPMQVISGFLRLVTNTKIFPTPSPCTQAVDFVDWLLEDTHVRLLGQTSEWAHFRGLVLEKQLTANHVPDAWLAALSLSLSEPFVTFDKGFRQLLPRSLLVLLPAE
ncbi:TA system VapC family ribonuclease toxin [Polaromonas sp.]|uniref:TA system VapC family ribonuclease toxin n=1 Tax=Polaromonas sp. TaxID=1869339 RepID=UPI002FC80CC9